MKHAIFLFFGCLFYLGCGVIDNVTRAEMLDAPTKSSAGLQHFHAENWPMGGITQDALVAYYGMKNIPEETLRSPQTVLSCTLGLGPALAVICLEVTLTLTGDIITLPYTTYKTLGRASHSLR